MSLWELYTTRAAAVAAIGEPVDMTSPQPPIVECRLIDFEDVGGVTVVVCGGDRWQASAEEAQQQLGSIGSRFGRRRVLLDFLDTIAVRRR